MRHSRLSPLRAAVALAIVMPGCLRAEAPVGQAAPVSPEAPALETLIGRVHPADDEGWTVIEVHLLNRAPEARRVPVPQTVEAELGAARQPIALQLLEGEDSSAELPPGGFATRRYRLRPATPRIAGTVLSIPAWQTQALLPAAPETPALARTDPGIGQPPSERTRPGPAPAQSPAQSRSPAVASGLAQADQATPPPPTDRTTGNAFLRNLSAYAPIYAVYGPGTNSAVRLQISFKYQLFGARSDGSGEGSWLNGLHFGYTQRMFWDVEADSSPFRNIDFQPELFYELDAGEIADDVRLGAQLGVRHESNGREGSASRSLNTIYIHPAVSAPLGGGYRITAGPRLRVFVGDLSDNPDIRDYRGNTGFFAELGKEDGLRLSAFGRADLGSGKGAIEANASYPLDKLLGGGPEVYLFGQGFVGYGENLLDYDVHVTRLRIGIALVR